MMDDLAMCEAKRILELERYAKWRDEQRRVSAHHKEPADIEAAVASRKLIATLQEKDDELHKLRGENDELNVQKAMRDTELDAARSRIASLELDLTRAHEKRATEATRCSEARAEVARLKSRLASTELDLDLAERKYSQLLERQAASSC